MKVEEILILLRKNYPHSSIYMEVLIQDTYHQSEPHRDPQVRFAIGPGSGKIYYGKSFEQVLEILGLVEPAKTLQEVAEECVKGLPQ